MPFRKLSAEELKADAENPEGHYACFYKTFYNALSTKTPLTDAQMIDQYDIYRELGLSGFLRTKSWAEELCDTNALLDLELVWAKRDPYEEPCGLPEMRCPKTHQRHTFGEGTIVGYSWHGPIHQATCVNCGFTWSDH